MKESDRLRLLLDVATEIAAIHLGFFAFTANNTSAHFLQVSVEPMGRFAEKCVATGF